MKKVRFLCCIGNLDGGLWSGTIRVEMEKEEKLRIALWIEKKVVNLQHFL